jgi:hypothetical protein
MLKATETTRFLVTSQGDAHPSWSQMLTPKIAPSFWSGFMVDSMAINGTCMELLDPFLSSKLKYNNTIGKLRFSRCRSTIHI